MSRDNQKDELRIGRAIVGFGLTVAFIILAVAAFRISVSRDAQLSAAGERAAQLARVIESGISGVFQGAAIVTDIIALDERFHSNIGGFLLQDEANRLAGTTTAWRFIQSAGLIDMSGRVVEAVARGQDGVFYPAPPIDLSASESFLFHRGRTAVTDEIHVGRVLSGFATGGRVIVLSKGLWSSKR